MRVVLSGGGTGGHIYPALAVASQCAEEFPGSEFLYIGGKRGLESSLVPKQGIPFEAIDITGFRRKLSFDNVKTVMRFLKGVQTSKKLLKEFKPDVVIGRAVMSAVRSFTLRPSWVSPASFTNRTRFRA